MQNVTENKGKLCIVHSMGKIYKKKNTFKIVQTFKKCQISPHRSGVPAACGNLFAAFPLLQHQAVRGVRANVADELQLIA